MEQRPRVKGGAGFLGYYLAYTTCLGLAATEQRGAPDFGAAMTWFVLPQ